MKVKTQLFINGMYANRAVVELNGDTKHDRGQIEMLLKAMLVNLDTMSKFTLSVTERET
jgi:hypothetical protein